MTNKEHAEIIITAAIRKSITAALDGNRQLALAFYIQSQSALALWNSIHPRSKFSMWDILRETAFNNFPDNFKSLEDIDKFYSEPVRSTAKEIGYYL